MVTDDMGVPDSNPRKRKERLAKIIEGLSEPSDTGVGRLRNVAAALGCMLPIGPSTAFKTSLVGVVANIRTRPGSGAIVTVIVSLIVTSTRDVVELHFDYGPREDALAEHEAHAA